MSYRTHITHSQQIKNTKCQKDNKVKIGKGVPLIILNEREVRSPSELEVLKLLDPDSQNIMISIKYNLNNFKNVFQKNKANAEEISRIVN